MHTHRTDLSDAAGDSAVDRRMPMPGFTPVDPEYARRVEDSFASQTFMHTLGVRMVEITPGRCVLDMPFRADLCQQNGFLHAGVTTSLADTAAGYAAFSLMPAGSSVLTAQFSFNLMAPAIGDGLRAVGEVERAGRTLTVVQARVYALKNGQPGVKPIALMQATMTCLLPQPQI